MFGKSERPASSEESLSLERIFQEQESALMEADPEMNSEDTELTFSPKQEPAPEIVAVVEKISGILSPYFIVLVGLFLYDRNVLIGAVLIFVGIFTLLKLSWRDLQTLVDKAKAFFQSASES
ncbi:MAG: hypothetical protein VKN60_08705 [Cyanobacteriota bacterium]|nr:hypothetical protein [Cyanobacteriota bacterium]